MLLTHLSGVFSRAVLQEETLTNPILEKIMVQYEEVANAIRKAVERIFQEKNYPKKRSLIWSFILRIHWNEVRKKAISVLQDFRQVD